MDFVQVGKNGAMRGYRYLVNSYTTFRHNLFFHTQGGINSISSLNVTIFLL